MMENNHILITGANGFVGRHLSESLQSRGARVSQIVRTSSPHASETQYVLDLTNDARVVDTFSMLQPDYVVHLAGSKNRGDDTALFHHQYNENIRISLNIIEACRTLRNFKRLISLGSCDEYGLSSTPYEESGREEPTGVYGLSKLAVTQVLVGLFHSCQFPSVVLRPTVIYGPGQGKEMFLSSLIQSLLAERCFAMTSGEQRRDFVYIDDVVDAIIKAIKADDQVNGKIVNIGSGVSYQIKDVAAIVAHSIHPTVSHLIKFGSVQYRPNEVMNYSVVIGRAKALFGWCPATSLECGIRKTVMEFKLAASGHRHQGERYA